MTVTSWDDYPVHQSSDWIAHPARSAWTIDPLAIDGAFQLAAYWAWTNLQRAGFQKVGFISEPPPV